MTKGGEHRTDGPAEQSGKHDACELWTSKPGEFGPEEASGPAVSGKPARIIRTAYFTDRGRALAERLFALWPGARPEYREKGEPLGEWTGRSFAKKRPVLFIGACGIAVRAIAPFVRDKLSDSPVLVMDEQGRHVIPILSGHIGGANALALEIARLVGADPVITTATDVNHLFAVDVFAKMNGLRITDRDGIRRVSARLLQNGRLHVFVEGDASLRNGMPAELIPCRREEADLVVLTSDGAPDGPARVAPRDGLRDRVCAIASIDRKADEQGLIDLAALLGVPFLTFSAETLKEMQGDFAGSAFVSRTVGVDNVCERAAAAAADGGELIIRKTAGDGITAAVARRTVRSLRWTDYRN